MKPSDLIHYRIQAAMRENTFPPDELEYLGLRDGEHWYRIAGEHEVPVSNITMFDDCDDPGTDPTDLHDLFDPL